MQGSGTFAVEATIGTLLPRDGKLLVLVNGAYGKRMAQIAQYLGRAFCVYETADDTPPSPDTLARLSPATRHLFDEAFIRVLVRRLHAAHEALAHPRRIL